MRQQFREKWSKTYKIEKKYKKTTEKRDGKEMMKTLEGMYAYKTVWIISCMIQKRRSNEMRERGMWRSVKRKRMGTREKKKVNKEEKEKKKWMIITCM